MRPEDSLPCSQEPTTGPYREPDQSSPLSPFHSGLLPSGFPTKTLYEFFFSPMGATRLAHLILPDFLILLGRRNQD
jgi:hypothetical protein